MSDLFPVPTEITSYHAPWLEAAAAGRLRYDTAAYPIHGLVNNAVSAIWHGLLADGPDGPTLTDLGRRLLADWHRTHPELAEEEDFTPRAPRPRHEQPAEPDLAAWEQPDLFATA